MIRLRRYNDPILAQSVAAYLRDNGIEATVVGDHVHSVFGVPNVRFFGVDLMIGGKGERAEAERLLEEFDRESMEMDEGWEAAALPDLSKLDPGEISVACPRCRANLPLDASVEDCSTCGKPVDVPGLIAEKHGPDALAACFADESVMGFALSVKGAVCGFCGYSLRGLPVRGRCPECGSLYDLGGTSVEGMT